jgi:hypothetical protein
MMCAEENECKDMKESDRCPIGMCNSCQCCFCYFNCPVENKKIEISVFETSIKNIPSAEQFALPDFISDCWQPPKNFV